MHGHSVELSRSTLARLPFYYRTVTACAHAGRAWVSSAELAAPLGIDPAQARRDLASIGRPGRAGVGYEVADVLVALERLMGLDRETEAALVGVGRLGAALFRYPGFDEYGLRIVELFDSDPDLVGQRIDGVLVRHVSEISEAVGRRSIKMGLITVPASVAQSIADALVSAGVIAIWNFAPVDLTVPPGVMVRDEDLGAGLTYLSRHLARLSSERTEHAPSDAACPAPSGMYRTD